MAAGKELAQFRGLSSFMRILKRAKLPDIRLYDLRRTVATLLLAEDVNVKVVSERLGHESITITLKHHYAHALPSMQQRAASAIEAIFADSPTNRGLRRQANCVNL